MEYELGRVRELRGMALRAGDPDTVRARVLECLATLGVDVAAAPPAVPDGPATTVLFWMSDEAWEIHVFAIPDEAISPAQRAALAATHFCFADPGDCTDEGWCAALRLMAALGDGSDAEDMYAIGVEESGYAGSGGAPSRQELADTWNAWDAYHVASLTEGTDLAWMRARLTAFHAFNKAM